MIDTLKSCARTAGVAGTAMFVAGLASLPMQAVAQDLQSPTAASSQTAVGGNLAQIVVRDAATGALRAATAEEAQSLEAAKSAARQQRRAPSLTLPKSHAGGARGARLTDEFMSYSVLIRQTDGRMVELCFAAKEEADAAVKASPSFVKSANAPTE